MRCSCKKCGAYMVHSEGSHICCVCPECLNECSACLGTDCVMNVDALRMRFEAAPPEWNSDVCDGDEIERE